jgi:hypothetical protein
MDPQKKIFSRRKIHRAERRLHELMLASRRPCGAKKARRLRQKIQALRDWIGD